TSSHGRKGIAHFMDYKGLNSTYKADWDSPFVGAGFTQALSNQWTLLASYDFLFLTRYRGRGHWNLRHLNFTHTSKRTHGFGHTGSLGLSFEIFKNLHLKAEAALAYFQAKDGHDKKRFQDGRRFKIPFHKAEQTSFEVRLGLNYAF
ncbi:MAG TPA: hypothetical protein VN457_07025, partial [Chlamydiales bacterium]|nr:hypothetical protein [Chlamydiales bacterium]